MQQPENPATIRVYWAQDIATAGSARPRRTVVTCSISWGADEANWGRQPARRTGGNGCNRCRVWWCLRRQATTTRATAAQRQPTSIFPHRPACGGVRRNARPRQRKPSGTTTPAMRAAKDRRRILHAFPAARLADWGAQSGRDEYRFRMFSANADPNTATTSFCMVRRLRLVEPAQWRRSMPDCSPLFGNKLGFITPELFHISTRSASTTSPKATMALAQPGP